MEDKYYHEELWSFADCLKHVMPDDEVKEEFGEEVYEKYLNSGVLVYKSTHKNPCGRVVTDYGLIDKEHTTEMDIGLEKRNVKTFFKGL